MGNRRLEIHDAGHMGRQIFSHVTERSFQPGFKPWTINLVDERFTTAPLQACHIIGWIVTAWHRRLCSTDSYLPHGFRAHNRLSDKNVPKIIHIWKISPFRSCTFRSLRVLHLRRSHSVNLSTLWDTIQFF